MGRDADFDAYLVARWPALVRTAVLLGCPEPEAPAMVSVGLAHCAGSWESVRRADDVDAYVYRAVLDGWRHRRSRDEPVPAPLPEDPDEDRLLRYAVEEGLGRVTAEQREVLVLDAVAGLDAVQVAEVLDVPVTEVRRRRLAGESLLDVGADDLRRAAGSIDVGPPAYDDVAAAGAAQRRRRWRRVGVGVLAGAIVVGGLVAWSLVSGSDSAKPPPGVTRTINPVDVAWYADGRLHLGFVAVDLPGITDLVGMDGGVVYGDQAGVVAFVDADGRRHRLGEKDPATPLVGAADEGWAAWIDPDVDGHPVLRVYDVRRHRLLGDHVPEQAGARPIAIDQRRVYYRIGDAAYSWFPGSATSTLLPGTGLLDVESATRVSQLASGTIGMVQPIFSDTFERPGVGGLLSPGGTHVLSRAAEAGVPDSAAFTPLVYDTRTGRAHPPALAPTERAVDATFGAHGLVTYLVAQVAELDGTTGRPTPTSLLVLRSCDLRDDSCSDVAPVHVGAGAALLAH